MFKDVIRATPWTTPQARAATSNMYIDTPYNGDVSFEATLRMFMHPREPANAKLIRVDTYYDSIPSDEVPYKNTGTCKIILVQKGRHTFEEYVKGTKEFLNSSFPEFEEFEKVNLFFRKVMNVHCLIDLNEQRSIVLIDGDGFTIKKWHYLQCGIPHFIPWVFKDKPVTEEEFEVLNSLRENSPEHYLSLLEESIKSLDFRKAFIEVSLKGYEAVGEKEAVDAAQEKLRIIRSDLDNLQERIMNLLRDQDTWTRTLTGAQIRMAQLEENSGLMDYFLVNKSVTLESVTGRGTIKFAVRTYMDYWDEDLAESVIDNPNSMLYHSDFVPDDKKISGGDLRKFLRAVFVDRKIKMRVCAAYEMSPDTGVRGIGGYAFPYEYETYMPNPHIQEYRCLGNYEGQLFQFMQDRKYIECVTQCIASCASINFGDGAVMNKFAAYLSDAAAVNTRAFELPDGGIVTPREALCWLYSQEQESNTEEEETNGEENQNE